jgi:hypothetical protein
VRLFSVAANTKGADSQIGSTASRSESAGRFKSAVTDRRSCTHETFVAGSLLARPRSMMDAFLTVA